jgi:putative acyl-CoA dehydrogenase
MQAALLARYVPRFVFDAFVESRLGSDWSGAFGTLSPQAPFDPLIERSMPTQHA